jgi:hypothetical protein
MRRNEKADATLHQELVRNRIGLLINGPAGITPACPLVSHPLPEMRHERRAPSQDAEETILLRESQRE